MADRHKNKDQQRISEQSIECTICIAHLQAWVRYDDGVCRVNMVCNSLLPMYNLKQERTKCSSKPRGGHCHGHDNRISSRVVLSFNPWLRKPQKLMTHLQIGDRSTRRGSAQVHMCACCVHGQTSRSLRNDDVVYVPNWHMRVAR